MMWQAVLKDNTIVSEKTHQWSKIKNNIKQLIFEYDGVTFKFPEAKEYIQYKSASASLIGGNAKVESQTVGCVLDNIRILLVFNFASKDVSVKTEILL